MKCRRIKKCVYKPIIAENNIYPDKITHIAGCQCGWVHHKKWNLEHNALIDYHLYHSKEKYVYKV